MIQRNFLIVLFIGVFSLVSCRRDPLDVNVGSVQFDGDFINLHATVYHADSISLMKKDAKYRETIADIYAYFRGYCLRIGDVKDTAFYNSILLFRSDSIMQEIDKSIAIKFADMSVYEDQMRDGFKHLKYHFKEGKTPAHIVYLNSVFQSNVFCTDQEIGIGLERYLGPENEVIKQLDPTIIFQWIKNGMVSDFLVRDVMQGWIETHYLEETEGNLAEQMIRAGKVMYLVEAALPEMEKHLLLRYTSDQLEWAKENEYAFWQYLNQEKLLFETNERNNTNLLKPGPTTPGLPVQGAPDRMGVYLGWNMVHDYMDQNEITLEQLMKVPYNKILNAYEIED